MQKLSVVIVTLNEETNIKNCLESVTWADEIVVVDDGSTDKTVEIAKQFTDKIYHHKSAGYVEPARNFAIEKAQGDWILLIDADEIIPSSLVEKLREIAVNPQETTHVFIPRKNIIFGKWIEHTGWWPDHLVRFFRKGSVTWKDEIHSIPVTIGNGMQLDGEENAIIHDNYQSIQQFVHKNFERYAAQESKELLEKGHKFAYVDAIRFPFKEFLSRYFAREGYKDGLHGLVLSLLMAVNHFLVFLYLWEKKDFVPLQQDELRQELHDELKKSQRELAFWLSKKKIEEEKSELKRIGMKLKRKLHL